MPARLPGFYLAVSHTDDIYEMMAHQEPIQEMYTGDTVAHIFPGESLPDPESSASFVSKVLGEFRVPYGSLTPTYSVCASDGYISGEHRQCPQCGGGLRDLLPYCRLLPTGEPVERG
ncbi:MAG: hypothetical protein IBX71_10950 [Candidatus Desulforudis sp.]|nr:hypothetical protein [Desulforudis sp.]